MFRLFFWFAIITAFPVFYPFFRTKVYYEDKKVQDRRIKGKALVVSNHRHVFDYVVIAFVFVPRLLRAVTAEIMYEKNFIMTGILHGLGAIKVDRNKHDGSAAKKIVNVLNRNCVVLIHPEGRIGTNNNGEMLAFNSGFVKLALKTGAPIIPVFTNGENFSLKRAKIMIGKPIDAVSMYNSDIDRKTNIDNISNYVRAKIIELEAKLEKMQNS